MTATAKVVNTSHQVVLDGGGKVTLSGGGNTRILYMNTCDPAQTYTTSDCWEQQWPQLVVQNMTFTDAYSATQETKTASYGGGAIFDEGGQLKVVNSVFTGDQCYASGPDLGGGAIRATGMYMQVPVYITNDTFTGNSLLQRRRPQRALRELRRLQQPDDRQQGDRVGREPRRQSAPPGAAAAARSTPTATATTCSSTAR